MENQQGYLPFWDRIDSFSKFEFRGKEMLQTDTRLLVEKMDASNTFIHNHVQIGAGSEPISAFMLSAKLMAESKVQNLYLVDPFQQIILLG